MTAWVRTLTVCSWLLLAWVASAAAQRSDGWDRYLNGHRGPYRGQVLDAETKAPLAGAVVVALWLKDRIYPFHITTERYAVRETVTDSEGQFLLEVKDIEEGAPTRVRRPEFLIFVPGYGVFPYLQRSPTGFLGDVFERGGTTVELPRLLEREDRRRNLRSVGPHSLSEVPHKDLPRLMAAIDTERLAVGLSPYPSPEK
ncbi:MAG: hypothetical protein ACHQ8D_15915 [Candidatus Rokuibacteriota bacterium]